MSSTQLIFLATVFLGINLFPQTQAKIVYFNGSDFKDGYYITPDNMPTDGSKVWVVADVHGAGGLKRERAESGLTKILAPEPLIILVPSFTTGYQGGDGKWAAQMVKNFKAVQKSYPVYDKMFLHGHSGGAQFSHRFAFTNAKYVIGVSASSAGSWATGGNFGSISSRSKGIPFTISCGEKDTAHSVPGYPHTRIEWFHLFSKALEKKKFVMASQTWPDSAHGVSSKLYAPQLKECFLLATQGILPTSKVWQGDMEKIAQDALKNYGGSMSTSSSKSSSLTRDLKAMSAQLDSGKTPDLVATMQLLAKHPASQWATDETYSSLKKHCQKSALAYYAEREKKGSPLTGSALMKFKKATEGLDLDL